MRCARRHVASIQAGPHACDRDDPGAHAGSGGLLQPVPEILACGSSGRVGVAAPRSHPPLPHVLSDSPRDRPPRLSILLQCRANRFIDKAMDELGAGPKYDAAALGRLKLYVTECIQKYGDDYQYSTDPRLLKIWILYADAIEDFPKIYKQLDEKRMFLEHAMLYEAYAPFLFSKVLVLEADKVHKIGITRKAEPLNNLKKMHLSFLKYLQKIVEEADTDAQDAINSHLVVSRNMDEVLCLYYTIEMLKMLETLHTVGIIHGDFKPDNILVCYPRIMLALTSQTFSMVISKPDAILSCGKKDDLPAQI